VIPFRISFRAGVPLFEQIVYASKKAMIAGQLRPGDPFPSVRTLSKELKINPNTAHKVVANLVAEGLLETRPGIGTVVAELPDSTRKERTQLLGHEMEELVVEAKHLGIGIDELLSSVSAHWQRLSTGERATDSAAKETSRRKS
jgi:GntR family transcriptional regulator